MGAEKKDLPQTNIVKKTKLVPPDGHWGWMVVLGTAVTNIFNQSMLSMFGYLYGDLLKSMGEETKGAALVLNTMLFVSNFGGPIGGGFLKLTSPRIVAVTGACFCSVGIFLSSFSGAMWHLVVTYGVLLGTGLGLIQTSTFVSINGYFKLNRGRAVGLAMAGTGIGQMLMPHVVRYLLEQYAFMGACLILSALSLNGIAGCLLLEPVQRHMKTVEVEVEDEKQELLKKDDKVPNESKSPLNNQKDETTIIYGNERHSKESVNLGEGENFLQDENKSSSYKELDSANISNSVQQIPVMNKEEDVKPGAQKIQEKSFVQKIFDLFDIQLLKSPRFINILVGTALAVISIQNFSLIYPFFLQEVTFLTKTETATCMSVVAGFDIVGRLTLPSLADKYQIKARWSLIYTSIWLIVVRQVLAYSSSMAALLTTAAFYGFGRSMVIVARNIAISENCRMEQVPAAVGLGMLTMGLLVLPTGLFLGWLRDYTQNYVLCITVQNLLLVFLLVTWIPDMMFLWYQERKKKSTDVEL